MLSGEITIRVRYAETDRMGLLHHANYLVYFEQARIELLRSLGHTYKDMEDAGFLLVLTRFEVRYRRPARYDEVLTIRTTADAAEGGPVRRRLIRTVLPLVFFALPPLAAGLIAASLPVMARRFYL